MLRVYQDAIDVKRRLLVTDPGSISTPSGTAGSGDEDASPFNHFKPKSAEDYTAHVKGGTFIRTRRHEALIKAYGEWVRKAGFFASTKEHPKDLVLVATIANGCLKAKSFDTGAPLMLSGKPSDNSSSTADSSTHIQRHRNRRRR